MNKMIVEGKLVVTQSSVTTTLSTHYNAQCNRMLVSIEMEIYTYHGYDVTETGNDNADCGTILGFTLKEN